MRWIAVFFAVLLAVGPARAEKVALLIGNAEYEHATDLRNPGNDVSAMATTLQALGFAVETHLDLDHRSLGRALLAFSDKAKGADTALVFYSGHGREIGGENYLIPVDAELNRPGAEKVEAIALSLALQAVSEASRLSVVIIDACRDGAPGGGRSASSRGFAPIQADGYPGLVIAFSTAPGGVAWDGPPGGLSPYTRALTEVIATDPDLEVRTLFTSLGADTQRYAGAEQRPFARFGDMPRGHVSLVGRRLAAVAPSMAQETPSVPAGPTSDGEAAIVTIALSSDVYRFAFGKWESGKAPPIGEDYSPEEIAEKYCSDTWGDCGQGDFSSVAPAGHDYRRVGVRVCANNGLSYRLTHDGPGQYEYVNFASLTQDQKRETNQSTVNFEKSLARVRRTELGDELLMLIRGIREYRTFSDDLRCED